MYILTVLDVNNRAVNVISIENERLLAIDAMLDYVVKMSSTNTEYTYKECVQVSAHEIHIYVKQIGYLTSSKTLESQVKIIECPGFHVNDEEGSTVTEVSDQK